MYGFVYYSDHIARKSSNTMLNRHADRGIEEGELSIPASVFHEDFALIFIYF